MNVFPPTADLLSRLTTPVWVLDVDAHRLVWANPAGLDFWRTADAAELARRDPVPGTSEAVAPHLRELLERLREEPVITETWTLFPEGRPQTVRCALSRVGLGDGRPGLQVEALGEVPVDTDLLRTVEAAR